MSGLVLPVYNTHTESYYHEVHIKVQRIYSSSMYL